MKITDLISRYPILAPCADSIEKAAEIVCPEEKRAYPEAFKIRILKSEKIK